MNNRKQQELQQAQEDEQKDSESSALLGHHATYQDPISMRGLHVVTQSTARISYEAATLIVDVVKEQHQLDQNEEKQAEEISKNELAIKLLQTVPQPLENLIDRPSLLAEIRTHLEESARKEMNPVQVIQDTEGVGKTQLAVMYLNSKKNESEFICWIDGDETQLHRNWLELGETLLGKETLRSVPEEEKDAVIREALLKHQNWAMVLDDIESETVFNQLLPVSLSPTQHVVVTTRSHNWDPDRYPNLMTLLPFTPEECQTYFKTRLTPEQYIGMEELVKELGALPLAMAHAGAYMKQTGKTANAYLKLYREKSIELLARGEDAEEVACNTVVLISYQLSMIALTEKILKAAELMKGCAYFHPKGIKKSFLKELLAIEEEELDDCIHHLEKYSLLSKDHTGFHVHRLVQQVIRHQLTSEEQHVQITKVVQCLTALNPDAGNDLVAEQHWKAFMPHLEMIIKHHDQSTLENEHLAVALVQLGRLYLYPVSQPRKSINPYQRALAIQEAHDGEDSIEVIYILENLGAAYRKLGDVAKERDLFERALKIQEVYYGMDHLEVARTLGNLSITYSKLGDMIKQRDVLERALKIQETHYALDRIEMAHTLGNLGAAYGELGDMAKARDMLERALAVKEAHYGKYHIEVARTLGNLGIAYGKLGDPVRQQAMIEHMLTIQEAHYGSDHIEVARSLESLGYAYSELGDMVKARNMLECALTIQEAHYGEDHIEMARTLGNLGIACGELGDMTKARDVLERAFNIQEMHHEENPIEKVYILENLGIAYSKLGDHARQRDILERVLTVKQAHYGLDHVEVANTLGNLGTVYGKLGDMAKAQHMLHRALAIKMMNKSKQQATPVGNYQGAFFNPGQGDQVSTGATVLEEQQVRTNKKYLQNCCCVLS